MLQSCKSKCKILSISGLGLPLTNLFQWIRIISTELQERNNVKITYIWRLLSKDGGFDSLSPSFSAKYSTNDGLANPGERCKTSSNVSPVLATSRLRLKNSTKWDLRFCTLFHRLMFTIKMPIWHLYYCSQTVLFYRNVLPCYLLTLMSFTPSELLQPIWAPTLLLPGHTKKWQILQTAVSPSSKGNFKMLRIHIPLSQGLGFICLSTQSKSNRYLILPFAFLVFLERS